MTLCCTAVPSEALSDLDKALIELCFAPEDALDDDALETEVRKLLEAGADPNDGESVFHAAERHHVEALELLLEFGVDLNDRGDWGNTPLYFPAAPLGRRARGAGGPRAALVARP